MRLLIHITPQRVHPASPVESGTLKANGAYPADEQHARSNAYQVQGKTVRVRFNALLIR
jgi:hypothetical protein